MKFSFVHNRQNYFSGRLHIELCKISWVINFSCKTKFAQFFFLAVYNAFAKILFKLPSNGSCHENFLRISAFSIFLIFFLIGIMYCTIIGAPIHKIYKIEMNSNIVTNKSSLVALFVISKQL